MISGAIGPFLAIFEKMAEIEAKPGNCAPFGLGGPIGDHRGPTLAIDQGADQGGSSLGPWPLAGFGPQVWQAESCIGSCVALRRLWWLGSAQESPAADCFRQSPACLMLHPACPSLKPSRCMWRLQYCQHLPLCGVLINGHATWRIGCSSLLPLVIYSRKGKQDHMSIPILHCFT